MKLTITSLAFLASSVIYSQQIDTQTRDNANSFGPTVKSGFFQTEFPKNFPTIVSEPREWWHLLDLRHTNAGNNYSMQFAGAYEDSNLWFRKTGSTNPPSGVWRKVVLESPSGNVGIGILNPESKLDVGTSNLQKTFINYQNKSSITFIPGFVNSWFHISHGLNNDLAISHGASVDENRLLTIKAEGNIGIGTNNPQKRLEVFNTASNGHLRLSANDISNADMSRIDIDFHISNRNQTIARIASKYENSNNGGYGGLRFLTSSAGQLTERLTITPVGYVGIDVPIPTRPLTVNGDVFVKGQASLSFQDDARFTVTQANVPNLPSPISIPHYGISVPSISGSAELWISGHAGIRLFAGGDPNPKLNISHNGNASLQGKFEAKEIKVTLTPTADFVFEDNYTLPKLEDVEKHIKQKKHLPEIASAEEMEKEGVNVGEFQIKLLQKIEELTLYSIDLNKKINSLVEENKLLQEQSEKVTALEEQLKALTSLVNKK